MRKLVAAVTLFVLTVGFAMAEEFNAVITKVDGNKVTLHKTKRGEKGKKGEKGEAETLNVADGAKVVKGKFNKEDKKFEAGDSIEGGLSNKMFAGKGVNARITTNDAGAITQVMTTFNFGGGDKKKKKKTDTN